MGSLPADPSRADAAMLDQQIQHFYANPFSRLLMDTAGGYLLVLNAQRQILAANEELLEALSLATGEELVGLRPGEALHCLHAEEGPHGCGTSCHCGYCGAVLAILAAQSRLEPVDGECQILLRREGRLAAVEFRIRVTPLCLGGEVQLATVLLDVSDQKRKEVFERLFFHDLVNTLQCLEGWGGRLESGLRDPVRASSVLSHLIQRLSTQVKHHRMLMLAERGELQLHFQPVPVPEVLASLHHQFSHHDLARDRHLEIMPAAADTELVTDRDLLERVLSNMVLNALEATPPGGSVQVWHACQEGRSSFHVKNPGSILPEVAMQVFHRSYSTKGGSGRGLGTYGMKLLGEDHLGGTLGFVSSEVEGTVFSITLPRNPPGES